MYDIVWLDGTYGIGKSTTAMKLVESFPNKDLQVLDSDYYYQKLGKEDVHKIISGGTMPQNNIYFIKYFREIIEEHLNTHEKPLIVVMALTQKECKEQLYNFLENKSIKILHVILTAEPEVIRERINSNRKEETKFLALEFLNENLSFLENNFKNAIILDTATMDCDNISQKILSYLTDK